jgi:adenine phosphoribosyltransferase
MKIDAKKSEFLKSKIRSIPGYPKAGIIFRDITTLLNDGEGFKTAVDCMADRVKEINADAIAGIESRGFIIGGAVAYKLGMRFVPIRKAGKLPCDKVSYEYDLEYGKDRIEVHVDSIKKGERVIIIDDLLATGGTALAAAKLVEMLGGVVAEMDFIVNLPDVGGEKAIEKEGYTSYSLLEFEGD